jgi:poly(3-hydroxybutyrate) depolymerase
MATVRLRTASVLALVTLGACGGRTALSPIAPVAAAGGASGGGGTGGSTFVPRPLDVVWPGAGCGKPLPSNQVPTIPGRPTGYTQFTVMGTGANLTDTSIAAKAGPRTFWVRVPADYDPNRAYRVVYGAACGGFGDANIATYQLFNEAFGGTEQAIYVAIDSPTDMVNRGCYDTGDGLRSQEWEAFQLFQELVDTHYCVDLNRIYIAGFAPGGSLANMWGCYFAGWPTPSRKFAPRYHIRGQVAIMGGEPDEQPTCGGAVAALLLHDLVASPSIGSSTAALARVGRMNGCDTNYDDASLQFKWHADIGDGCREFAGCPLDSPVVFCTTRQGTKTDQSLLVIPATKLFFEETESGQRALPPCAPACVAGVTQCIGSVGLRTCDLDAAGCPVLGALIPCGPNTRCCTTCGPTAVCRQDANCPVVPAGCSGPGTFCLDANTVATCAMMTPDALPAFPCAYIESQAPCPTGQTCDGSAPLQAVCR